MNPFRIFFATLVSIAVWPNVSLADVRSSWQAEAMKGVTQLQAAQLWIGGAVGVASAFEQSIAFSGEIAPGSGEAPHGDSVFEIGSLSKSFTGILLAEIVGEHADLSFDDPVAKFLPQLAGTFSGRMTLRQLATHTSGLPRLPCADRANSACFHPTNENNPYADYTATRLLAYLKTFSRSEAGPYARDYSNTGVALLGYLLTQIEKKSFDELFALRITGPLDMPNTKVLRPNAVPPSHFLEGFKIDKSVAHHWEWDVFAPTGGIISTAPDMMKYLAANTNPPDTALGRAIAISQAQGLCWDSLPSAPLIWKNGQTGGFHSIMIIDSKTHTGLFALSNMASSYGDFVGTFPLGVPIPDLNGLPLTASQLQSDVGQYRCEEAGFSLEVKQLGNFLFVEAGDSPLRLEAVSETEFNGFDGVNPDVFHHVSFQTGAGTTSLTLHLNRGNNLYAQISCSRAAKEPSQKQK